MKRKITLIGLIVVVAAAVAAAAALAINGGQLPDTQTAGHVVIQGTEGGDPGSTSIAVKSWSWGGTNANSGGGGGGGGSGRASLDNLSIVKTTDKASPSLALALVTGRHIPRVTLTLDRPGGSRLPYYEIRLDDVLITSIKQAGADQNIPLEELSFSYGRIDWKYTTVNNEIVETEFTIG